ncbi:hypothetical protein [Microbulbifer magnicolonia]|uniref:hypothetical protein n=1 Tax=Microbulbifer magnicolonia TaxID=3109744 RepID=UPI002B404E1E|nr:hypothetical protein [Microbulbifer sp. GG15]
MKKLLACVCALALLLAGCTSLKPVEMTPQELHAEIKQSQVVQVGDRIKAVTMDGKTHEFRVTEISATTIFGKNERVEIAQIVALETRQFSGGKTALLAGGAYLLYILALLAAAPAFVLSGG